jgi:aryl-alcohol dehydrogenase-like predicted oxidoreductase
VAERTAQAGVTLSRLTLGTMRLSSAGDVQAAADLIDYASDAGLTSLHCSSEYESFPLFVAAWNSRSPSARLGSSLMTKVASPHFGEDRFSATALRSKVDDYLQKLTVERLDVVQWLLRFDLKQEDARLRIFEEGAAEIAGVAAELKQAGKIGSFVSFPYTKGVGEAALRASFCDGLALYVNPLEREMDDLLMSAETVGKPVVAIRPFAAGRLFSETGLGVDDAVRHVFAFPAVTSAIVSVSSRRHVDALRPHS